MHPQTRRLISHVEFEQAVEWMNAFNLYLGINSIFDFLVNWFENPSSFPDALLQSEEFVSLELITTTTFIEQVVSKMFQWQKSQHWLGSLSPLPCIPSGEPIELWNFSGHFSFHIFIHRFLANTIREFCKYDKEVPTLQHAVHLLREESTSAHISVDFPLLNIVLASQIKVGMWRRNGQVVIFVLEISLVKY